MLVPAHPRRFALRILALVGGLLLPWTLAAQDPTGLPADAVALKGHTEAVYAIAFTPDGKHVVTASFDRTLKVWDAATGKEVRTYGGQQGHQGLVLAVALTADGLTFASGGADNNARLWDFPASTPIRSYAHTEPVNNVSLSPDGKTLAGAGQHGNVRLWNSSDGKQLHELKGHTGPVTGVAFNPNGQMVATSGSDRTLRLWDVAKGQLLATYATSTGPIRAVAVNPNTAAAYTVGDDGLMRAWRLPAEAPRPLPPHAEAITAVALNTEGSQVLTASADKSLRLSLFANAQPVRQWKGTSPFASTALSPNAALVAGGATDGRIALWNSANDTLLSQAEAHAGTVAAVAFSPASNQLLTGGGDGLVKVWSLPPLPGRLLTHPDGVLATALSADGKRLVTGSADKMVRTWNLANPQQPERLFTGHEDVVRAVALSANGQLLASGGADATIRLWNQANGQTTDLVGAHGAPLTSLAFHPNGQQLLSASEDGTLKVWQLPFAPAKPLGHADQVTCAVLSPDGARMVTGCADKTVRLWNLANNSVERSLSGPALAITAVAFSGNGAMIAASGADKMVLVWNSADGKELKRFANLAAPIAGVVFSGDGKVVAAGLSDGTIRLLDIASGKELKSVAAGAPVTGLTVTPKGDLFLATTGKSVQVFATADGTLKATLPVEGGAVVLGVSRDGTQLVVGGADKSVRLLTLAEGKATATFPTPADIKSIAFTAEGNRIVVGGGDGKARVFTRDGKLAEYFRHTGPVVVALAHPDGKRVVSAGNDKTAQVWQTALLWQGSHTGPVRQAVFSPRGEGVYSVGDDKTLRVWAPGDGKALRSVAAHAAPAVGLGFTGDGARFVTAGADGGIHLWTTGKEEKPASTLAIKEILHSVTISPNGSRIAVGAGDKKGGILRVLDATTGKELQSYSDHAGPIRAVQFASDNRTLTSASLDRTARVFDVAVAAVLEAHPGGVTAAAYHNNGTQALTAGADKTVKLWDLPTGKLVRTYGPLGDAVRAAVFSRDFASLGAAAGTTTKVWNVADGKELSTLTHPAATTSLAFSADRTRLVVGYADQMARVWDLTVGRELQAYPHAGAVQGVAFHPNGQHVITASADKTATVYPVTATRVVVASEVPLRSVTVLPSATHALTAGDDGKAALWNLGNGVRERLFEGATGALNSVTIARNNVLVATGGADGMVRLHTLADGKMVGQFKAAGPVRGLAFSASNQALAAASADGSLMAWNVVYNPGQPAPADFGKALQRFGGPGAAQDVTFAPDNVTFYSAAATNAALAWKLAAEVPLRNFPHPREVDAVAFNPTGTQLATGCHDGNVRLFDVAKGQQLREIKAHAPPMPPNQNQTNPVYAIAWNPAGTQVLSASMDNSLKLWDAAGGTLVRDFKGYKEKEAEKGHRDPVFCATFSPDGKVIASGSAGLERGIKLWNAADGSHLRDLVNPSLKVSPGAAPAAHPGWIYGVRFTPDGKYLVSVGGAPKNRGYLAIWNVADGKLVHGAEISMGTLFSVAVAPDGKRLAVSGGATGGVLRDTNTSFLLKMPDSVK